MTILVRDEEELIRANLEYHLHRGVDFVIATDNRSQDRTAQILREYEKLGLLHYIFEPADDYSQDLWVTRMARIAAETYGADWVMHVDADEFWWPSASEGIPRILESVGDEIDGLVVPRSNFVPIDAYNDRDSFYSQLTVREKYSLNALGRPLPPKICHRGRLDVNIHQGNHSFDFQSKEPEVRHCDEILILHFPQRGYKRFQRRIRQGGAAYERNERLGKNIGNTWRELYTVDKSGNLKKYYDDMAYSRSQLAKGIEKGELVSDTRLMDYMKGVLVNKP